MKNEEVIANSEGGKAPHKYNKRRKANWIDHILLMSCFLNHVIERKVEGLGRRRGRCKQLLWTFGKMEDTGT